MQGMTTFESLHPRAGGTGPDRTQFAAKTHRDAGVILAPEPEPAVQPMDTAPMDGEVIEVLSDGKWQLAYWSETADDGSPYGTEGWKTRYYGMVLMDAEGWREPETAEFVDEGAGAEELAVYARRQEELDQARANAAQVVPPNSGEHPMLGYFLSSLGSALRESMHAER